MESAGRRQGERAGSAESTWSAARAVGGAGRRCSGPTSQPCGTWVFDDGWMGSLLATTRCGNVFDYSVGPVYRFKLAVSNLPFSLKVTLW